jgi:hypothetical protein
MMSSQGQKGHIEKAPAVRRERKKRDNPQGREYTIIILFYVYEEASWKV